MGTWFRTPRFRSLTGGIMGAGLVVAMLGLMACLPVPVGDPEESKIDERLTGAWVGVDDDGEENQLWVFRPWDARTWLVLTGELDEPEAPEGSEAADAPAAPAAPAEGSGEPAPLTWRDKEGGKKDPWKVWVTQLGGVEFATFEAADHLTSEDGFRPEFWFVLRVEVDGDEMVLTHINYDFEEFGDLKELAAMPEDEARAKVEAVIARNAKNPEFYSADDAMRFRRIAPEDYDVVRAVLGMRDAS